jgi:MATE family multidrug resistance protein
MGCVWLALPVLDRAGIHPQVLAEAKPYLRAMAWGTLPLMLYSCFRRYLQSLNVAGPVMFALVTTNLINVFGNWLLIYGNWGFRAMGAEGSGWATTLSRIYLAVFLLGAILYYDRRHHVRLRHLSFGVDRARLRQLAALGFPAAAQISFEVAVFAVVTALIARLDPEQLAGHQIALNAASVTYMIPLGLSSAAAVRVGQAIGRRDAEGAAAAGWTGIALGAGFMSCAALAFWLTPRWIARAFTPDIRVIELAVALLAIAALFQLFDGIQAVATGALRGAGDTRTPMLAHVICYWLIGLPLGAGLGLGLHWGAAGLWIGLCAALILIGVVLLRAWRGRVAGFAAAATEPPPR